MREYIVRIIPLERVPLRVSAQHVFTATNERAAERLACQWAADIYGGHEENYDAKAMTAQAWNRGESFRGAFA